MTVLKKKVMCFGTFDGLHPGHLSYLKQAKKFGEYLIVVIARDQNVKKIKGFFPINNEKIRLGAINKLDFVGQAVLGQARDRLAVIKKFDPDIICLGYDQKVDLKELRKVFGGRIIKAKPYQAHIFKSSKLKNFSVLPKKFTASRIQGDGRGTRLGFPTINLDKVNSEIDYGVYLVKTKVGNKRYRGLLHFGPRKTIDNKLTSELYLLEKIKIKSQEKFQIEVIRKIREIKRFKTRLELKKQIKQDITVLINC